MLSSTEASAPPAYNSEVNDFCAKTPSEQRYPENEVPDQAYGTKVHKDGVGLIAACLHGEPNYIYWLMTTIRLSLISLICFQAIADFAAPAIPITVVALIITGWCSDFENPYLDN